MTLPTLFFGADGSPALYLGLLGGPFALLCLLGFQNAVNMADGADGLVIGMALGWVGLLLLHAPPELTLFLWICGASLATTLPFNLRGKLFLGDAGSYAVSVLIGMAAIHTYNASADLSAANVMLWFILPVADCLRLIGTRLRMGRSPFEPDRNHLHHRLAAVMPQRAALAAARGGRGTAAAPGAAARILGDAGVPVHPADHVAGAAPVCLEQASLSRPATAGVEPEFAMGRAEAVSPQIVPVILSGGSGTRLWPLSRSLYPKQFLPLASERTLLQETLLRVAGGGRFADHSCQDTGCFRSIVIHSGLILLCHFFKGLTIRRGKSVGRLAFARIQGG